MFIFFCYFISYYIGIRIFISYLLVMFFSFILGFDLFRVDEFFFGNFGFMMDRIFICFFVIYIGIFIF